MTITAAHRDVAKRLVFRQSWDEIPVTDSLLALITFVFTEEEARVVAGLRLAPARARTVAGRVGRPVEEVEPLLASLAERVLIAGIEIKGVKLYGMLPLMPGIFETVMIRSKNDSANEGYYREFARLFEEVYVEYMTWVRPRLEEKDVRVMRVIPINQSLDQVQGVMPLDTDRYLEIVDRNKSFALVNACACRRSRQILGQGCGKPLDVCSAMGVLADLVIEKGLGYRVSKEAFLDAKSRAAEAGLVNLTDNLHDPLQVCSCCACCCGAIRILKDHNIPTLLARSHFEATVDPGACVGCGACADICPMEAIKLMDEQEASIDTTRCIGCGLCVGRCDPGAISLREREGHIPPSENLLAYYAERFAEIKGACERPILPRLARGLGRLLGNDSRIALSGPGYKPKDE